MSWSSGRGAAETGPVDRPVEVPLDALADPYRRAVLSRLVEADDDVGFDRLVDQVVDAVDGGEVAATTTDRSRVATRLYHLHLPKLADAGLLAHEDWESFEATDRGETAAGFLESVDRSR